MIILNTIFPTAAIIQKSPLVLDKQGSDFFVVLKTGHIKHIDFKFRPKDFKTTNGLGEVINDDLILETQTPSGPGWTVDDSKITDYVIWLWVDTGRWKLVGYKKLREHTRANKELWDRRYQIGQKNYTDGYGYTPAICVPCDQIEGLLDCVHNGYLEMKKEKKSSSLRARYEQHIGNNTND